MKSFRIGFSEYHTFPSPQGVFINIESTGIESLPDDAFVVNTDALRIRFYQNEKLTGKSFSANTFLTGANETMIQFEPVVSYLNETVFTTFFKENKNNNIEITDSNVDCSDVRNKWLSKFADRIKSCDMHGCKQFKPCSQY